MIAVVALPHLASFNNNASAPLYIANWIASEHAFPVNVAFSEVKSYQFDVVNRSSTIIELVDVAKSCTCLEATIATGPLRPGEKRALTVKFQGDVREVSRRAVVIVEYQAVGKDSPARVLELPFAVHVTSEYLISPPNLDFGLLSTSNEEACRQCRLAQGSRSSGALDFRIIDLPSLYHNWVSARVLPAKEHTVLEVCLSAPKSPRLGGFNFAVKLAVSSTQGETPLKIFSVPVRGYVSSPILSVSPSSIFLRSGDDPISTPVALRLSGANNLLLEKVMVFDSGGRRISLTKLVTDAGITTISIDPKALEHLKGSASHLSLMVPTVDGQLLEQTVGLIVL